jgi:GTPase KRas
MLEVLDTAGQEEYTALRDQWIRDGEGFVLVYSITSRPSFVRIQKFYNQIQLVKESAHSNSSPTGVSYLAGAGAPGGSISAASGLGYPAASPLLAGGIGGASPAPATGPVPVMLVGNKSDKGFERAVSAQEGSALAKELGCEFVEASAKNCTNVEKAFYDVVRLLRQQRQQQQYAARLHDRRNTAFGAPVGAAAGGRDLSRQPLDYSRSFRQDRGRNHRRGLRICTIL